MKRINRDDLCMCMIKGDPNFYVTEIEEVLTDDGDKYFEGKDHKRKCMVKFMPEDVVMSKIRYTKRELK